MKRVIFNADDFGASTGINRGILECLTRGVVSSVSLMVTGRAAREAAALSRDHPDLSIGLHWDVWGEDEREFDLGNALAVREEFARQLDAFHRLVSSLRQWRGLQRLHARRCGIILFRRLGALLAAKIGHFLCFLPGADPLINEQTSQQQHEHNRDAVSREDRRGPVVG